jgi:hypothetical protein
MGESGERAIFAVKEADAPRNPLMIALFFINIVWLRLLGGEWFVVSSGFHESVLEG